MNHLMYGDDICLMAPSLAALQQFYFSLMKNVVSTRHPCEKINPSSIVFFWGEGRVHDKSCWFIAYLSYIKHVNW